MMKLSLFSGAYLSQILMLIIFITTVLSKKEKIDTSFFFNEFYILDPIFRLICTSAYIALAAGVLVKIWHKYGINYIHIMEVS